MQEEDGEQQSTSHRDILSNKDINQLMTLLLGNAKNLQCKSQADNHY